MKKKREVKLGVKAERIRELVLEKERAVIGGLVAQSGYSFCYCSDGGGGPTNH